MLDKVHLHWGRIIDNYDDTYVYDVKASRQQVALSPQVMDTLHTDGGEAIDKLYALGNSASNPDWNNASNRIPLPMLQSLMDYTPFSYEYGHLCFRILMLAFDYCVMKLSDTFDDWMTEATQPKNQLLKEGLAPMLSKAVSELIDECIVQRDESFYSRFTVSLPWTDSYKGPLVNPPDIRALTEILDEDRKHFLIFLRSNYSLRLSALLYTMFQVMHRTPPTSQNLPYIQAFLRVYMRSLLLAPGYPSHWGWQHQYVIAMSKDYQSTSQRLDTEDSKLVIRAYTDRLTILSDSSPLHPRVASPLAAELLQYVLPFIGDGCESLIPSMLCAVIQCMWQDLGENFMETAPAEVVDACVRLFQHFKHLCELLGRNEGAHASILMAAAQTAFDERITELFGRLLLELFMTGQGYCDDDGPASALTQAFRGMSVAFHQDVAVSDLASRMAASSLLDLISREDFDI